MELKLLIKTSIMFALVFVCSSAYSQNNSKTAIAPFRIQLTNGDSLFAKDLKKNTPAMLIYFSPECEHCQAFTRELLKKIKSFNNTQLVFITYQPVNTLDPFVRNFNLSKYPNIQLGTEGYAFIVRKYYNIINFPFLVLYDKNGKLVKYYRTPPGIDELIKQFELHK